MKGIDITKYVNAIEYRPTIGDKPGLDGRKGILRCVKKLKTVDMANIKELRAR
jgi:hypothetical protein